MGSVGTGHDFGNSSNIANSWSDHSDMLYYNGGAWNGLNPDVSNAVGIQPPVDCDGSKAAFLRVVSTDTIGQGIGFKLSTSLEPGSFVSFEMTYVSHGVGSNGAFQPEIYTSPNSNFLDGENEIQALYATTGPQVGTEWQTVNVSWNVNSQATNHNWIWVYAPESSGLVFNMCQIGVNPVELETPETVNLCPAETQTIGQNLGSNVNYSWSNGDQDAQISVSTGGVYSVTASNFCNSETVTYIVVVHEDPELLPPITEVFLCVGDSIELSTTGLNPVNSWPDGSSDPTWWLASEGTFNFSVTDDCTTANFEVIADYDTIPFIDLGPDFSLCEGQTADLDGTVIGTDEVIYSWGTGQTEPIYTVVYEDTYSLTVENECGTYTDEIFVEYSLFPDTILPDEVQVCLGRDHVFDLSSIDAYEYTWQDGSTGPTHVTEYTGPHSVIIVDDDFCWTAYDTVEVKEGRCECPFYMPNAFTPDWDGLNDWFKPVFECAPYDYLFEVYDRWGVMVFRGLDPNRGWDGRIQRGILARQDTYHWRVWYREEFHGIPIEKFGSVTVVGHGIAE